MKQFLRTLILQVCVVDIYSYINIYIDIYTERDINDDENKGWSHILLGIFLHARNKKVAHEAWKWTWAVKNLMETDVGEGEAWRV